MRISLMRHIKRKPFVFALPILLLCSTAQAQTVGKSTLSGSIISGGATALANSTATILTTSATGFFILTQACGDFSQTQVTFGTVRLEPKQRQRVHDLHPRYCRRSEHGDHMRQHGGRLPRRLHGDGGAVKKIARSRRGRSYATTTPSATSRSRSSPMSLGGIGGERPRTEVTLNPKGR